jgi:hypothetical protein
MTKKAPSLPAPTAEEALTLLKIADQAMLKFRGQGDEIESALGMLLIGRRYGWRVIYLLHSKRTVSKYESLLGINVREFFPETGPLTYRSIGFRVSQVVGSFWKAVSGEVKVTGRREFDDG